MSYATISSILGWCLAATAGAMLAPAAIGAGLGETAAAGAFGVSALLTAFVAGGLIIAARGPSVAIAGTHESVVGAVLVWTMVPLFGALPFLASGAVTSLVDAYFESVSGFTTTGLTVLTGLDGTSRAVLFWRALTQWLGGAATVVLVLVHIAHLGVGGMQLSPSAIVHGEQDPLLTRLRETATAVLAVYAVLTAACFVALSAARMPLFDAAAHALSAVSTGGFSTRDGSVGAFANPTAEGVLVVFMLLGAANVSLHWMVVRGQGFGGYRRDPEARSYLAAAAAGAAVLASALWVLAGSAPLVALRHGVFLATSALTTTGFSAGTGPWPLFVPAFLMVLMLAGGATGSASGGLKTMRVLLLLRLAAREFLRLAHPHGVRPPRYAGRVIDEDATRAVWSLFVVLAFGFGLLTLGLAAAGADLDAAAFAAAAALSNTGPVALVLAGESLAGMADGAKLLLCTGMVLGRIEFFTVLLLFTPLFWRR